MHPSQPLLIAAGFGIVEIVTELVRSNPDLIWTVDEKSHNIFHVAVMYRGEKIFDVIHDLGAHKDMITTYKDPDNNNNLLHLAAKLAPLDQLNSVSGAALQMQRELLWFKESFSLCNPQFIEMVDIVPILQIDMVWCYFVVQDISSLSLAGIQLQKAREGIERAH
ncbi:uncharacterized protein LOC104445800 [Eucalyptus grandis]|uniref:uncharacterized protein LOC104445800 n=1 Tax=Eucalyptus grandis TaxID=71139 RepID=UPI00192EF265|nr:uncharacterized protein LOC104445800 [Eucalyptus grandis]